MVSHHILPIYFYLEDVFYPVVRYLKLYSLRRTANSDCSLCLQVDIQIWVHGIAPKSPFARVIGWYTQDLKRNRRHANKPALLFCLGHHTMEKFKEKLQSLRAAADSTNAQADELEARVKHLKSEHIAKDHEILSLQIRVKNLEERLEKTEGQLKDVSTKFSEAEEKAEENESKVASLDRELEEKEKLHEELKEKHVAAKSQLDDMSRQFDDM
ncbi:hypothetical protein DFQ30_003574 [Apophysomyces sp. BC1015]|nr:hypothetical protein DFQ30_003574 [Apophysomyces sp. BC1015]